MGNNYEGIVEFANSHFPPHPARIVMNGVEIFSEEVYPDGTVRVVRDVVKTMADARAVLGY